MKITILMLIVLSLGLTACTGEGGSHSFENIGLLCASAEKPEPSEEVSRSIDFEIRLDACLQSSDHVDRVQECSVVVEGNTLNVTSTFGWRTLEEESWFWQDSTLDCAPLIALCEVPSLEDGEYEIWFGEEHEVFILGNQREEKCLGSAKMIR